MADNSYTEKQANFAINFLRQTLKNEVKTVLLSPFLISIDLVIIYNGASDETAKQIAVALTGENACLKLNKYFIDVWRLLQKQKESITTLHRIYVKQNIGVYERFLNIPKKYFDREVKSLDFSDLEAAQKEINEFIKIETNKSAAEFIPQEAITSDTSLLIINMLSFHGEWLQHFEPLGPYSMPEEFYFKNGDIRYVYMMTSVPGAKCLYHDGKDFEVLGLEYAGTQTMSIILPKKRYGLANVVNKLNGSTLMKLAQNKEKKICDITIPRFELTCRTNAKEMLENLGIKNAFNASSADFSNLTPDKSMFRYDVIHEASVTVYENGHESAWISCRPVWTPQSLSRMIPDPEITFTADHPFLYFIADENCNILLLGTIVDNFQSFTKKLSWEERRENKVRHNSIDQRVNLST